MRTTNRTIHPDAQSASLERLIEYSIGLGLIEQCSFRGNAIRFKTPTDSITHEDAFSARRFLVNLLHRHKEELGP